MNILFPPIRIETCDFESQFNAQKVSREELLSAFELPLKVTGGFYPEIFLHSGFENIKNRKNGILVGVGSQEIFTKQSAATALEILAHHFHDYPIRESVCGKGITRIFDFSNPAIQVEAFRLRDQLEARRRELAKKPAPA